MSEQTNIPTRLDQSPEQSDATRFGHGDVLELKKKTLDHLESLEVGHARAMVAEVTDAAINAYAAEGIDRLEEELDKYARPLVMSKNLKRLRDDMLDRNWSLKE